MPVLTYSYNAFKASTSLALSMAVSISFDFVLTSALKVDTALGTEYSATSVAFNTYQSVGVNKADA